MWHTVHSSDFLSVFLYIMNGCQTQRHLMGQASKNRLVIPSTHVQNQGSATPIILCVCFDLFIWMSVHAPGDTHTHRSRFKAHVSVEWQVESLRGGCDGQSSYFWFKERHGSEPGGGSSEGNTKAAFCFVLSACLSLSFLIIFSIWKYVFAMRVQPKTSLTVQRPKESITSYSSLLPIPLSVPLVAWPSFINTDVQIKLN